MEKKGTRLFIRLSRKILFDTKAHRRLGDMNKAVEDILREIRWHIAFYKQTGVHKVVLEDEKEPKILFETINADNKYLWRNGDLIIDLGKIRDAGEL